MIRPDLWYKEAILYQVDVRTYMDSNGDGIGDFTGLIEKLDHISNLGITCLWILPFYPSPGRDNGYDVTDHFGIDERLGNSGDFVELIREAHSRGLRVVVDLVINHTSDLHPWFQRARADPDSPFRDYYFFRERPPAGETVEQVVFEPDSDGPWTYDDESGAYYFHRFYSFEPDLNMMHPEVQKVIKKVIEYWIALGVDGFRIDAAPYLGNQPGVTHLEEEPHELLRAIRDHASSLNGDVVLLAEADVDPRKLRADFGEGREVQLLYNFYVNNFLFLAFARETAGPIVRAFEALPDIPESGQWLNWIRNHDELDLERLSEDEREEVYAAFAPDDEMRVYGRGIRRRFPPMVDGDRRCMELAFSLLLSLPGTPIIRAGQEIGMGDDLSQPERWSVRTVMQWSAERHAGFSTSEREQLVRPLIADGQFGYERVNVADQRRDPESFLNWMVRAIGVRRECREWGHGCFEALSTDQDGVLAHTSVWNDGRVLALHNLSGTACHVRLDLGNLEQHRFLESFSDRNYECPAQQKNEFELGPYAYRWFRLDGTLR